LLEAAMAGSHAHNPDPVGLVARDRREGSGKRLKHSCWGGEGRHYPDHFGGSISRLVARISYW
jgi:hypothetical protein